MNPQAGVNILVLLFGLAVVAVLCVLGRRMVAEQHPWRRWASDVLQRKGLVQTARLAGGVVLVVVLGALTLWYA